MSQCPTCGAPDIETQIEHDRTLYNAAHTRARAEAVNDPYVRDSVSRIFTGWDGPDAAHARSVARFRTWHHHSRAEGGARAA